MEIEERGPGPTLSEVLARRSQVDPDRPFLLLRDRRLTFEQVNGKAQALARALNGLGVEPGDRVALVLPGCPEFVISFFALARLGAVAVPLNPRLSEGELRYMLRHSEAVAAISVESFHGIDYLQLFEDLLPQLPELQYLVTVGEEDLWYDDRIFQFEDLVSAGRDREPPSPTIDPRNSVVAIVYTSGTTGKPKGVELTHENLLHAAAGATERLGLTSSDRVFGLTALFHVYGLAQGIVGCALTGSALVLQEEFDAEDALNLIEDLRVSVHYGLPTVFAAELRAQRAAPRDLSSLRLGVVAGAPLREEWFASVEAELCHPLVAAYSLTETSSVLAMSRPEDAEEKRRFTVGTALPGVEIRVVEPDGSPLPVESLGEIAVRGPGVMKGYYRQPRETRSSFTEEGFLLTGDLGILDDEGFVHLVGPRGDVIIRSGNPVYPREVEDRLHAHPAVRDVAVIGMPDDLLGEAVCVALVPEEGAIVTSEELREWCMETLAEYKVPDRVRFLDELPQTATGKIRRVDLARLLEVGGSDPEE